MLVGPPAPAAELPAPRGSRALPHAPARARPAHGERPRRRRADPGRVAGAGVHAAARGRQRVHARRSRGQHDRARLLPVRVQPGVHRPDRALRGRARRLPGQARRHHVRRLLRRALVADGVPGEARREHPAAVGLRAQGRGLPRLRRLPPRRLPAARAGDRRTRRRRRVELPGPIAAPTCPGPT